MRIISYKKTILLASSFLFLSTTINAADNNSTQTKNIVDHTIKTLMEKNKIPGMAVAVTIDGKNYFYNYGVLSTANKKPVTNKTLFEIGSDTKTFTATLADYAVITHKLSLSDNATHYFPTIKNSDFDKITLLNFGTQTTGLPLFIPDDIKNNQQLMNYLQQWKPTYPVGTHRIYSNMGIGLLGVSTEKSMHDSYVNLLQTIILNPLQLQHTYVNVPNHALPDYAQGYTEKDEPVRVHTATLWQEAYGIKSCSHDLIRYIQANMQEIKTPNNLQQALLNTHTAYFKSAYLTQDLIWEQYTYPTTINTLLTGNGKTYLEATTVTKINPPLPPQQTVLINKTGGTDGFSSYLAFIPAKKMGIVILANKQYPTPDKVTAGYTILSSLVKKGGA